MDWETPEHLEQHFYGRLHHRRLGCRSIQEYDASAQETVLIGVEFTYIDSPTRLHRIGFFHRDTSRFVVASMARKIVSHFQADEAYVASLEQSTYRDD
jgi:hypothetical protein